jgi:hypothetical protein
MNQFFPRLLMRLLYFSILLGLIAWGLTMILPKENITPALPYQFIFFVALTIILTFILNKAAGERFLKFLNTYLLLTTVKLLFLLLIIVIYCLKHKEDAIPFTITFFLFYVCFSIFEVVSLVSYAKRRSDKEAGNDPQQPA